MHDFLALCYVNWFTKMTTINRPLCLCIVAEKVINNALVGVREYYTHVFTQFKLFFLATSLREPFN